MEPCMNCRAGVANDVKGSARQREAARLYDEEGLSYEQVGIRLGGITRQRATQLVEKRSPQWAVLWRQWQIGLSGNPDCIDFTF